MIKRREGVPLAEEVAEVADSVVGVPDQVCLCLCTVVLF